MRWYGAPRMVNPALVRGAPETIPNFTHCSNRVVVEVRTVHSELSDVLLLDAK